MKKPVSITYGVDEVPPPLVAALTAFQHVVQIVIRLLFPVLVAREAGLGPDRLIDVVSMSMLVMAIATVLQALPRSPVGSGYLCPPSFTSAYVAPALLAAKTGGMALVCGMTVFGGAVECALSRLLRPLRPFFPPEIAGFVVVVVAVTIGSLGTRYIFGVGTPHEARVADLSVTAIALGTMVVLNVWTGGALRLFCALIGMAVGYLAAGLAGVLTADDFKAVGAAPFLHLPRPATMAWGFDIGLVVPFAVAALAACLRAMGDVTTCQKINDADWTRPDMRAVSAGVLANGLSTASGGLLGTIGVNTLTSSVGLTNATGVTSRRIAYPIAAMLAALAFFPKASALIAVMPRPVLGATLWFSAAFILINGLQVIMSRMLDARKTLVIGLSFTVALAVDLYPSYFRGLPAVSQPFFGSALVLGTLSAFFLNAVFRAGVRSRQTMAVEPGRFDPEGVQDFMESRGAAWGARREVIDRASFNLTQSIETILEGCDPQGPLEVEASFDEFNLDLRVSYTGLPLELPVTRPTNEEIMASDEGQRRLAGFLLRRYADRVESTHKAGRASLLFHFDH